MAEFVLEAPPGKSLERREWEDLLRRFLDSLKPAPSRVLLVPPDGTRRHSGAGTLTNVLYHLLVRRSRVQVLPATGTHRPMDPEELRAMFGDIPLEAFLEHHWRRDTVPIGTIPGEVTARVSHGAVSDEIVVAVNRLLPEGGFDLILSIGQVLPHEVVGMANYTKNIVVGLGGEDIINKSHYISAVYGIERTLGRDRTPVRELYDYAETRFLDGLAIRYLLTVNHTLVDPATGTSPLAGLYIGRDRKLFEQAVALSRSVNITRLVEPISTFVVYLDEKEFRSTWLGCKAIYRTRLAVADGGHVVMIAPGLERLGEDPLFDRIIRKYGYVGTERITRLVETREDLRRNLAVAAHLIHGSTEGRFHVTVATDTVDRRVIQSVGFGHMSLEEARQRYRYQERTPGRHTASDGSPFYYIANPAAGLWAAAGRLDD